MLEARSSLEFRARPYGAYQAGQNWSYFSFDSTLFGYAVWGRPEAEDIEALVRLMVVELDRPLHAAVVDLSGVETVTPRAFESLVGYTVKNAGALTSIISQTAIARPRGVVGAIVSGFFEVAAKPFPVTFWPTVEDAFKAVGRNDAAACAATLAEIRSRVSREPILLRTLREVLEGDSPPRELATAAQRLGVSQRTLQRRLTENGSSFENELAEARVRAARVLLETSDEPVSAIAVDLGFSTPQHFATTFKKAMGVTPTSYRARNRQPG